MTTQEQNNWKKTIEWIKSSYRNIHLQYNSVEGWARVTWKEKSQLIYHFNTKPYILFVIEKELLQSQLSKTQTA